MADLSPLGAFLRGMRDAVQARAKEQADRESDAVDKAISDAIWDGQLPQPEGKTYPRVIRSVHVNVGTGYELPGSVFPDGLSRVVVNPLQTYDERQLP